VGFHRLEIPEAGVVTEVEAGTDDDQLAGGEQDQRRVNVVPE
jgi:hypothetical protein